MNIDWQKYEHKKKKLPKNLSSDEYEAAIKRIIKKLESEVNVNDDTRPTTFKR